MVWTSDGRWLGRRELVMLNSLLPAVMLDHLAMLINVAVLVHMAMLVHVGRFAQAPACSGGRFRIRTVLLKSVRRLGWIRNEESLFWMNAGAFWRRIPELQGILERF